MAKVSIYSQVIINKTNVHEKGVTMVTIANYGIAPTSFLFNGIKRVLPAIDVTFNVPVGSFEIQNNGHHFDIDIEFTESNTNIVLDYAQLLSPKDISQSQNC